MPQTMSPQHGLRIARIEADHAAVLRAALSDYLREFAQGEGVELPAESDGQPVYPWFAAYWHEPHRIPIGFWEGDRLVGFCLLRDDGEAWQIAEVYVAPTRRRRRIGSTALGAIVRMCESLGGHDELRAKVHHWNRAAGEFWRTQGFEPALEDEEEIVMTRRLRSAE